MKIRLLWLGWLVGLAILAGCETLAAENKPATPPSFLVNLWMTYPLTGVTQTQLANLVVYDAHGQPVSGATGVLVLSFGSYKKEYIFPLTDVTGQANVTVDVPAELMGRVVLAKVTVIQSGSMEWGEATAEFKVLP